MIINLGTVYIVVGDRICGDANGYGDGIDYGCGDGGGDGGGYIGTSDGDGGGISTNAGVGITDAVSDAYP